MRVIKMLTEDEEKRTIWVLGKPYHWTLNEEGRLSLQQGPSEHEKIRWEVVDMLIGKGMSPEAITAQVIDDVINAAEAAAIMEAVSGE